MIHVAVTQLLVDDVLLDAVVVEMIIVLLLKNIFLTFLISFLYRFLIFLLKNHTLMDEFFVHVC